jgi:hypothetical protein
MLTFSSEPGEGAKEMKKARVSSRQFLESREYSSVVLDLAEEAHDQVALTI